MKTTSMFNPHLACALLALASTSSAWAEGRIRNLRAVENGAPYNGFIVKFKDGSSERLNTTALQAAITSASGQLARSKSVDTSAKANPAKPFGIEHVRRMALGANVLRATRSLSRNEALATIRQLASLPNVDYVEPNLVFQHTLTPNDTLYGDQWGFGSNGIRADLAWDMATGTGVTVAVLDTGVASHPDLNANIVAGYDFVTDVPKANDGDGRDADASDPGDNCPDPARASSWHGTHVSGTIAAVTGNSTGVAGGAFGAKVMPVRVLGRCNGSLADIADAIVWSSGGVVSGVSTLSASAAAKVINMSLGAAPLDCPLSYQEAINGASSRGTTVVAAAGNSNVDAAYHSPSNCPGVISVAAVDALGNKASFSNFGPTVDIAAPGVAILSTLNSGATVPVAPTYVNYNGTSMAAPHVASVVALIQSRRLSAGLPLYSPTQVEQVIKGTARPLAGSCLGGCGAGMADAYNAVAVALANSVPVSSQVDASGKISVTVFERSANTASGQFTDFAIEVPSDYVVIGGGVEGALLPQGHLLTASYPNAARSAWLVSTKEHSLTSPAQIKGWAIGLKVTGLTRAQLLTHLTYRVSASTYVQQPNMTTTMSSGYTQIGGGFLVNWTGNGNLAWASYPTMSGGAPSWTASSKDQGSVSAGSIRSYSIGLRTNLPGVGVIASSVNTSPVSSYVANPSASVFLPAGFALTSCGAKVNWSGAGSFLWKLKPVEASSQLGCEAAAKEHLYSSPATLQTYAVGIKVN